MIGILGNKQNMPETGKKELFSAGITYMTNGEYAFAYFCFTQIGKANLAVFYNKALCCYHLSFFEECRSLLLEAERLLPPSVNQNYFQNNLPANILQWEYENSPTSCPMPLESPANIATIQLLRLKAEISAKLLIYNEVQAIHARLDNKYQHIEELIKTQKHEIQ